jgi:hypothetical protein
MPHLQDHISSRLIDVSGELDHDSVRIVHQMPLSQINAPKYAALSYCWVGKQPVTTLTLTLAANMHGLDISSLPKTIRDTITATQRFRTPYVWVDSLCIVQDDAHEVAREISKMASYFENAYVTICAATARACTDGFLEPRRPPSYSKGPIKLPCEGFDGETGQITLATVTEPLF